MAALSGSWGGFWLLSFLSRAVVSSSSFTSDFSVRLRLTLKSSLIFWYSRTIDSQISSTVLGSSGFYSSFDSSGRRMSLTEEVFWAYLLSRSANSLTRSIWGRTSRTTPKMLVHTSETLEGASACFSSIYLCPFLQRFFILFRNYGSTFLQFDDIGTWHVFLFQKFFSKKSANDQSPNV